MKPAILLTLLRGADRIAETLLDRGDIELILLYDIAAPALEGRGIPFRRFSEYMNDERRDRVAREIARCSKAIGFELYGEKFRAEWPAFHEEPYKETVDMVAHALRNDFFEEAVLIDSLRYWASVSDLRAIVVHQDLCRDTKTLMLTGHRLGIPTFHIAHGFPYGCYNAISMRDAMGADYLAVFSERHRDLYCSLGFPAERLLVTGNPEWDVFGRMPLWGLRERLAETFGLDPAKKTVTYAITYANPLSPQNIMQEGYVGRTTEAVIAAFAELERQYPDWQFVLRPHPNDPDAPKTLKKLSDAAGLQRVVVDDWSAPISCIGVTDVLVCTHSNFGIEALIAGKPVVNCVLDACCGKVFEEGVGPLFLPDDAVITVREADQIAPSVVAAMLDPATREQYLQRRPETIRRFNDVNDGKATERVCDAILHMAAKRPDSVSPVTRYPEFETMLAASVPRQAKRIFIGGSAARYVRDALCSIRDDIETFLEISGTDVYDAVVLSEPVPHTNNAEPILSDALANLAEKGTLVAPFYHGASAAACDAFTAGNWAPPQEGAENPTAVGQYSFAGINMLLSRGGMKITRVLTRVNALAGDELIVEEPVFETGRKSDLISDNIEGWVVCAKRQ